MTRQEGTSDDENGQPGADEASDDDGAGSERPDAHLRDLADGCGCAEVWEHLSETRDGADDGVAGDG